MPSEIQSQLQHFVTHKSNHNFVRFGSESKESQLENKMVCLFCLKEVNEGVLINGASESATNARNIIAMHFWFDVSSLNLFLFLICLQLFESYNLHIPFTDK